MQIMKAAEAPRYGAGNLREGADFSEVVLLHGRENALDNFRLYYSNATNGEWKTPRHRHNFEQIRLPLAGEFEYAKDKRLPAGWVAYFPESVHYGPQIRLPGLSMLTLQFGGASRSGYLSEAQRRRGYDELRAKGTFEKGAYSWIGENGSRKPLFSPAASRRRSTPSFSMVPVNPKPSISTPMEPMMLALST